MERSKTTKNRIEQERKKNGHCGITPKYRRRSSNRTGFTEIAPHCLLENKYKCRLHSLREQIDRIDDAIIALLGQRGRVALKIGRLKKFMGSPLRVPKREQAVLDRISRLPKKRPYSSVMIKGIYRAIMTATRALQKGI